MHQIYSVFSGNFVKIITYLYVDKKPVYFLTTAHSAKQTTTVKRQYGNNQTFDGRIPTAIEDYNKSRCDVDRVDQLATYYTLGRRSRRWWLRLAWWLIEMCLNNSWRLFQLQNNSKISSFEFRKQLMLQLSKDMPMPFLHKAHKRSYNSMTNENLTHLPRYDQQLHRCHRCTTMGKHKSTHEYCQACNIYLCTKHDCFFLYHQQISRE